jgi:hypothetical protein
MTTIQQKSTPTPDGSAAARIEEEVVVTEGGCRLLTRFPADHLYVAGARYWTGLEFGVPGGVAAGNGAKA